MATKRQGLSVKTFQGLNKNRFDSQGGFSGKRMVFDKKSPTNTIQFLEPIEDFIEFDRHVFKEDGRWTFVPCIDGDDCPLCASEDEQVRRLSYTFACNVWNVQQNKVQVLEGPKTLASLISYRYERKPAAFLKRVFDITRFPTSPVTFNFELAEEKPVSTTGKKAYDLEEYVEEELKRYYGEDLDSALADLRAEDDEDEDDDEEDDADDFEDSDDEDDEDDEDDFEDDEDDDADDADDEDEDDDEDDDEDEDEPPARARRSSAATKSKTRPAAKRAPAKKAPARKSTRTTTRRR